MKKVFAVFSGFVALFVILTIFGMFYTIDQGERGVILRFGRIVGVANSGLGWKFPWFDTVQKISTQTHIIRFDKLNSYSFDQQPADLRISVNYHVDPFKVATIYERFGTVDNAAKRVIEPIALRDIKIVFGQFTAITAVQKRDSLNSKAKDAFVQTLGDDGIVIENVNIEDISYSNDYLKNVEERMKAEVEVQKLQQNALRERVQAEITVTRAQAEADSTTARAKADSNAIILRGNAEADAIKAKAAALANNPLIVDYEKAQKWNGVLPTQMLPNTAVPMIGVK